MNIMAGNRIIVVFASISLIVPVFGCEVDEKDEASEAFTNCVHSAESSIFARIADEEGDRQTAMCTILDDFFSGCEQQILALKRCEDSSHVEHLKRIRLTNVANILKLTYPNTKPDSCSIFKSVNEESNLASPAKSPQQGGKRHNSDQGGSSVLDANAANKITTYSLFSCLITVVLSLSLF